MKINNKKLFLVLLLTVAVTYFNYMACASAASVIYVNNYVGNDSYDGGSPLFSGGVHGPKATIQNGIDVVESNGAVYVANGVYREQITINKNVNIIGKSQKGVILSGNHSDRAIIANKNLRININCITVQNTGGIYSKASLTLKNIIFKNNRGDWDGAIYNMGNLKIYNAQIRNNTASYGSIVYNDGAVTIINTIIRNNVCFWGGGIYNGGKATLKNTTIQNNYADFGGGIFNVGKFSIKNSKIQYNKASYGGGIYNLYVNFVSYGKITIIKSKIRNNKARYWGGGIYNDPNCDIKLNYNQVTGNTHYAIYTNGEFVNVNAKYNWWGSKKPRFSKIIKGKVIYKPWLRKKPKL